MLVVIATLVPAPASPTTLSPVAAHTGRPSHATRATAPPPAVQGLKNIRLGAEPTHLVQEGHDLFALGLSQTGLAGTVVRVDLAMRREVARTSLPRAVIAGAVDKQALYVIVGDVDPDPTSGPATLIRLDRATLRIHSQVALLRPQASLAVRPEAVYALQGPWLERRDRETLAIVGRLAIPEHSDRMDSCDSIDSAPETRVVWVSVTLDDGRFRVVKINAHDLSVLYISQPNGGVCGAKVSATSGGIWAGFPTGLLSTAERFDAATGESGARLHSADGWYPEPNSAVYLAAPRALWVSSGRSLTCANVRSGLVMGSSDLGEGWANVLAVTERQLFVGRPQGVAIYTPASACRGRDR